MSDSVPSGSQWLADTVSANTGLVSMAIFKALEIYRKATQLKPASAEGKQANKKLRLDALNAVVAEAVRLARSTTSAAQTGVLFRYASLCLKRIKGIEAAAGRVDMLRTVFAPSYAGNPTARAAQRVGFVPQAKTLSGHHFWLEKIDPLHHSWRQGELMALYAQWEADHASPLNLWDWLALNGSAAAAQLAERVIYMAPDRQWENACTIEAGGVVHKLAAAIGTVGDPLWTCRALAPALRPQVLYHPQFWAFVISPAGRLYVHPHQADLFHHSSMLAGGRVLGAGMIGVSRGRIVYLSNKSGHYMPTPKDFFKAVNQLKQYEPHLNLDGALVEVMEPGDKSYLSWGGEWLSGRYGDLASFEGPLPSSNDRATTKVGKARYDAATLIERGLTWASMPTEAALIGKSVELALLTGIRYSYDNAVPGTAEWLTLRAQGYKTEAERPRWFF